MSRTPAAISKALISDALKPGWDFGNEVLYRMCREHPAHDEIDKIVAKVWLIGRSYSAAIERRRNSSEFTGDNFYIDCVGPAIKKKAIDQWFEPLRAPQEIIAGSEEVVRIHGRLTALFFDITKGQKRSLAAKYLHFHFPNHFYIYDAFAEKAVKALVPKGLAVGDVPEQDPKYALFSERCKWLQDNVLEPVAGRALSPRELDKVLLHYYHLVLKKT